MNKKYIYQLGVVVFITLTAFSCEKDYPNIIKVEVLNEFNISIAPEKLEYKVGDTIWLTASITEADLFAGSGVEGLKNGTGSVDFRVLKLRENLIQVGAENFDLIYLNGDTQVYEADGYYLNPRTYVTRIADMEYQNQAYVLNIGLIPKSAADYCFYLEFASRVYFGELFEDGYQFSLEKQQFVVNNSNKKLITDYGYADYMRVGNTHETFSLYLEDETRFFAFSVKD